MRHSETFKLGDILNKSVIKNKKIENGLDGLKIKQIWVEINTSIVVKSTTDLYTKGSVLYLSISSSIIRNEIMLNKSIIIDKINTKLEKEFISNIILR